MAPMPPVGSGWSGVDRGGIRWCGDGWSGNGWNCDTWSGGCSGDAVGGADENAAAGLDRMWRREEGEGKICSMGRTVKRFEGGDSCRRGTVD